LKTLAIPKDLLQRTNPPPTAQPYPLNSYEGAIDFVCVLRESPTYGVEDVNRLYHSLVRYAGRTFAFHCLTDSKSKDFNRCINVIKIKHKSWETKQSKLEMFRPDLGFDRVVYFDLDTLIIRPILPILSYDGDFMCLGDFGGNDYLASGILLFKASKHYYIYEAFKRLKPSIRKVNYKVGMGRGDQLFLAHNIRVIPHTIQEFWPSIVISYNKKCRGLPMPKEAAIVVFHGKHKPKNARENWIKDLIR